MTGHRTVKDLMASLPPERQEKIRERTKELLKEMAEEEVFRKKVHFLMPALQKDLKITKAQAAGIVGSLAAETGGFKHFQELTPQGHRGGWGWAQWTGVRRRVFEKKFGVGNASDYANYKMLTDELKHDPYWSWELERLKRARTVTEAARTFTGSADSGKGFLRPGVEHYEESEKWAKKALEILEETHPKKEEKMEETPKETPKEDVLQKNFGFYEKALQRIALVKIVDVDEVNTMKLRAVVNVAQEVLDWVRTEEEK